VSRSFLEHDVSLMVVTYLRNLKVWIPFKKDVLHGTVVGIETWFEVPHLSFMVRYKEGIQVGQAWKMLPEAGYLQSQDINFEGETTYVYPGFEVGLHGRFKKASLISSKAGNSFY